MDNYNSTLQYDILLLCVNNVNHYDLINYLFTSEIVSVFNTSDLWNDYLIPNNYSSNKN